MFKKLILYVDNQSAIQFIKDQRYHCRTKHIDTKYKFIRDYYKKGLFELKYICSKQQQADFLTKPLSAISFVYMRSIINLNCSIDQTVPNND